MKKMLFFLILLTFLLVSEGAICNGIEANVYFFNQEDSLVGVSHLIEMKNFCNAEIIRKVVNLLLEGPREDNLFSFIPEKTKLNRVILIGKTVILDFSKELQGYGGGSFNVMHIREQFEKTIFQFSFIKNIIFTVEGKGEYDGVLQP
jgi:spore germination protein GerM